jgi:hypothetical protein
MPRTNRKPLRPHRPAAIDAWPLPKELNGATGLLAAPARPALKSADNPDNKKPAG